MTETTVATVEPEAGTTSEAPATQEAKPEQPQQRPAEHAGEPGITKPAGRLQSALIRRRWRSR